MNRHNNSGWQLPLCRPGPLALLGCAFLLGGALGAALGGLLSQESAAALGDYLQDYLTLARDGQIRPELGSMLWEQLRFFLGTAVLGVTVLGVAGVPVLFALRGALLAFSTAGICRACGLPGLPGAFLLFGLPALLWAPVLFVAGAQSMEGALFLLRRLMEGGRSGPPPYSAPYWGRLGLCAAALCLCVVLEYLAAPALLALAAQLML